MAQGRLAGYLAARRLKRSALDLRWLLRPQDSGSYCKYQVYQSMPCTLHDYMLLRPAQSIHFSAIPGKLFQLHGLSFLRLIFHILMGSNLRSTNFISDLGLTVP